MMMTRMRCSAGFFTVFYLAAFPLSSSAADEPLRTAADRIVDVEHIRLDLDVKLKEQTVEGSATISFTALRPLRTLSLDAVEHEILSVELLLESSSRKLASRYTGKKLLVTFPQELPRGAKRKIVVRYRLEKPRSGLRFFGPTKDSPKTPLMMWSHGEPISNRYWFPCVDHPNERQSTEVIVTVPAGFEAVSNGRLVSRTKSSSGRRVRFH